MSSFGTCDCGHCDRQADLVMNGRALCLECFESDLQYQIRKLNEAKQHLEGDVDE